MPLKYSTILCKGFTRLSGLEWVVRPAAYAASGGGKEGSMMVDTTRDRSPMGRATQKQQQQKQQQGHGLRTCAYGVGPGRMRILPEACGQAPPRVVDWWLPIILIQTA